MPLFQDAKAWAFDKSWGWRAPVLAWGTWMAWCTMTERPRFNLFAALTFQVHEFGHLAFALFGTFVGVAGGSLMQLLVPIGAMALMYRQKDWFGIAFSGTWLAQSLVDLAYYIGDSRSLLRDYVSLGGEAGDPDSGGETTGHDWQYLLQQMHLITHDTQIAAGVRALGMAVLWASIAFSLWLFWQMWRGSAADADGPPGSAPRRSGVAPPPSAPSERRRIR
jgi:hypothetical protein